MNLPQLPADKANHLIYGLVIALAAAFLAPHSPFASHLAPSTVGLITAALFGVLKEASDWLLNQRALRAGLPPPHSVELFDALATAAGGLLLKLAHVVG